MELHPIKSEIYTNFVCGLFNEFDKSVEGNDVMKVYDVFEGNTYYMQKHSMRHS